MPSTPSFEFLQLQAALAGRYSLERELGRGGMGIVFLARDVALDRPVAIKLLPESLASQPELRERFFREARTAAKLSHPNIVPIHLVESSGDLVYFVMTFVDGETLGQRVRRTGPLPAAQVVKVIQESAWALAYAHSRGIVHRDVKPDNILLDKDTGRAMLTDFGIASVAGSGTMSRAGEIVGTAHYMSPEQATGDTLDGRSDLFSLGVTAFFALTGTLPFEGPHLPAVVTRIVSQPAPHIADVRPGIPGPLAQAIDRCLSKQPAERFASGEELADAVRASVVSSDIAPQLRHFLKTFQVLDVLVVYFWLMAFTLPTIATVMWSTSKTTVIALFYFMLAPLVGAVVNVIAALRHVVRAGFSVADVRRAFAIEVQRRREEMQAVGNGEDDLTPRIARRERLWTRSGHVNVLLALGSIAGSVASHGHPPMSSYLFGAGVFFGAVGALSYVGAAALRRTMERLRSPGAKPGTGGIGMAERLIGTRVMTWLHRLAGRGIDVKPQPASPANDRTEVIVAAAVDELFARLPDTLRARFDDVPQVAERLQSRANALREQRRALDATGSHASDADRARVADRLANAVAALEALRLDLLRLESGAATPDDLTADLERAREVGRQVDARLQALGEIRRVAP